MAGHFNSTLIPKRALKYFEANRNVLVIEDDKVLGQMVTEILDDVGFEVTTAQNGRIAFEKLKNIPIDFIVLDILLPEKDGFEIYAELQATLRPKIFRSCWLQPGLMSGISNGLRKWGYSTFYPSPSLRMNCCTPS